LKSDVTLRVEAGATILGSTNIADYAMDTDRTMYNEPYMNRCLIFARNAKIFPSKMAAQLTGVENRFRTKATASAIARR